ncbi:Signal transducer regulating beta-lactamase production, contains metallopeptidase domain [Flavobacterium glycines]|uniref:Signal transducer regulating beta-lactamase production, contains metallopeptidase domain n=1 Tax=Flavobacterium glycines TaxID=551990 RepID=A0A1B9DPX1_9FLAO|nr:M56 family metallopeptidase [Flavobacterium glycines]OCB71734.1 hypothetical protein FBGL_11005 [Flavobacterium glycines]GEL10786.1 hypothetical protein FGL01_15250 [Flavobacterium glycines]SDI54400.1 Signal transducer regulating beta-lactamase production, contains metallopeptidase domain [Flavobacterium glycines]
MTDFLIKSTLSLAVLLAVYFFILEKEKMHQFNRFYLLFSLLFSFVIPFITIEIIQEIPHQETTPSIIPMTGGTSMPIIENSINYWVIATWGLYGLITLALLIRFVVNIWKLNARTKSNSIINYKNAKLVLLQEKTLPYTFLNYIFINETDYHNRKIEAELYTHELIHVSQKHTLDILLIETLKVIFWFNPIFILYKKAIQLNHEFLADEKVVKSHNNVLFYQNLLLSKANANPTYYLASNLNYSVTKKRLIMMTKTTSKSISFLKQIALIPLFTGITFFLCIETIAQNKTTTATAQKKQNSEIIKDQNRDRYYAGVRVIVKDYTRNIMINKVYEKLSIEEKRRYLGPPYPIKQQLLPSTNFESYKDPNKYAIWIDGIHVPNNKLKNYKSSDFAHYSSSYVYKNARSKRFPQNYQCSLYTKKYFEENLKNSHLKFKNKSITIIFKKPEKLSTQDSIKLQKAIQENLLDVKKDLLQNQNKSKLNTTLKKQKNTIIQTQK